MVPYSLLRCAASECCMKMKRFSEALKWCDVGQRVRKNDLSVYVVLPSLLAVG